MTYQQIANIPTNPQGHQQHYQEFRQLLLQTYGSANVRNPGYVLKQSLISLALFGYGNDAVERNEEYLEMFERFQAVLSIILPESIGFQRMEIRMPDVVLITKSGEFSLDAMSGGISSIFSMAWQIQMFSAESAGCTVIIDEPENHLHPSMQRTFLPNLEKAFPDHKFIIATHSPFIVTSNPNANVFGLIYNEENRVKSRHLSEVDLASSSDRVLRDILDVPSTIPIWVEEEIRKVFEKHSHVADDGTRASEIFEDLRRMGINDSLIGYKPKGNS